jgi:hypothetical protein
MKKFLKNIKTKILFFVLIYLLMFLVTISINYNHKTDYPAAIKGKSERLDSLKEIQKIIIAGGSSSSYSIDSKLLQKVFKTPVVNTSLAMSLGSKFHLNLTKDYLKKGDIILYIPEYEFYYGKELGDDFLYTTAFYYPQIIKDFTFNQQKEMLFKSVKLSIDFYISYFKNFLTKSSKKPNQYSRNSYNRIGDNISLISIDATKIKPSKKNRYQKLKSKKVSDEFLNYLKEFKNECDEKGVQLLIAFPPIEESQFDDRFIKDASFVKEKTGIKFLGLPKDYIYAYNLFYDSSYHLNGVGRKIRTKKLLETLKQVIK